MQKKRKRTNSKQSHEEPRREKKKKGGAGKRCRGNEGAGDAGGGGKQGRVEDEFNGVAAFEKTVPCTQSAEAPLLAEATQGVRGA